MNKRIKVFQTVTFRLTLYYAILFGVVSLTVFGLVYVTLTANLKQRMDETLRNDVQAFEMFYRINGIDALREEFKWEAEAVGIQRVFFRIISPRLDVMATSDMSAWKGLVLPRNLAQRLANGKEALETLTIPGTEHHVRVISKQLFEGNIIQIGNTVHDDEELVEDYRQIFTSAVMIMLLCGAIVGWFVARRAMAGVERITETAVGIGKGDLSRRVPQGNEGEEINHLAMAFNDMLERIQGLVKELREVTNNIAHDLRSPLTRIRGIAETTLTGEPTLDAYREMAGMVIEESDRLVEMINIMLEIAMAESGVRDLPRDEVDMTELAKEACELFHVLAEDKQVWLGIEIPQEHLIIPGDRSRLQRIIANLLDNAIKFTPRGGNVLLFVEGTLTHVIVSVADTGMGIDSQDLPHIFERFYRADRSRSTPGNGLGLSLVQALVRCHSGEITVESNPGKGSKFTLSLPRPAFPNPEIAKR